MTLFDFLYQAGFWQWFGILLLAGIVFESCARAIVGFSPFCRVKNTHHHHHHEEDSDKADSDDE